MRIKQQQKLPNSIVYSVSIVPNKHSILSILGKTTLSKEELSSLRGKPLQIPGTIFVKLYLKIQQDMIKGIMSNKEVRIVLYVPEHEPYKILVDTKKIGKISFLSLLQESIMQEEDVQQAENLYQKVVLDLNNYSKNDISEPSQLKNTKEKLGKPKQVKKEPSSSQTIAKTTPLPVKEKSLRTEQSNGLIEHTSEKTIVNDPVISVADTLNDPQIKIYVDFLKTVDVGKSKIRVTDPEYEKEKYNQEARKVNQLINSQASSIEKSLNERLHVQNEAIRTIETSESIRLQNEEITKNNPSELIQLYQQKEKELDKKKRERIFSLNEELEAELQELRQNYEKQKKATNEAYFKKKNNEMATCTYQFETWISNEFQSKWNEHYRQLKHVLEEIEEENKQQIRMKTNQNSQTVQEYTKRVKTEYAEAVKNYLDRRKPLLKQEILSDITIYQKQIETKQLSEALTKEEVSKLLHEQEMRLQQSLIEEKQKLEETHQEPTQKQASFSIVSIKKQIQRILTKRVKIVIVVCLMVSLLGGLGFSVYKKITYVAPFDTMISSEDYDSAIKNYPNQKYEVINVLYEKVLNGDSHALSDLEEINHSNKTPLGSFDLAIFDQEYSNALAIYKKDKSAVPKKYWEKRYAVLGYCYLKDGQVKEAESFQEKSGDQVLLEKISDYKQLTKQITTLSDELDTAKKQSHLIDDKKEKATYDSKIAEQEKAIAELKSELKKI